MHVSLSHNSSKVRGVQVGREVLSMLSVMNPDSFHLIAPSLSSTGVSKFGRLLVFINKVFLEHSHAR